MPRFRIPNIQGLTTFYIIKQSDVFDYYFIYFIMTVSSHNVHHLSTLLIDPSYNLKVILGLIG